MKNIYDCILESNNDIKHGNPPKIKKEDVIPYLRAFYNVIEYYEFKQRASVPQELIVSTEDYIWLMEMVYDWLPKYSCNSLPGKDRTDKKLLIDYNFWESQLYEATRSELDYRKYVIDTFKNIVTNKWPDRAKIIVHVPENIRKFINELICMLNGKTAINQWVDSLSGYLWTYRIRSEKSHWSNENLQKVKKYEKIIAAEIEKIYNKIVINNTNYYIFNL